MFGRSSKIRRSFRDVKNKFQKLFPKDKLFISNEESICSSNESTRDLEPNEESSLVNKEAEVLLQDEKSSKPVSHTATKESRCINCKEKLQNSSKRETETESVEVRMNSTQLSKTYERKEIISIYKNASSPRGLVFMQNVEHFDDRCFPRRKGSDIDYKNLICLFTQIGYKCDEDNLYCRSGRITGDECITSLNKFSMLKDHEHLDSCLIVIMSHGSGDKTFISSDGKEIKVKDICKILNNINCKNLKDKPKILIFQFCRTSSWNSDEDSDQLQFDRNKRAGRFNSVKSRHDARPETLSFTSFIGSTSSLNLTPRSSHVISRLSTSSVFTDSGYEETAVGSNYLTVPEYYESTLTPNENVPSEEKSENGTKTVKNSLSVYDADSSSVSLPTDQLQINSDFYLVFSTIGGEVSYRDPESGSFLIRAICHIFRESVHSDNIETLFKKVSLYMKDEQHCNDCPQTLALQTCERINIGFDRIFFFNPETPINSDAMMTCHKNKSQVYFY